MRRSIPEAIAANIQKTKFVGEYVLSDSERLEKAGSSIVCEHCGEEKYYKRYSPLLGRDIWDSVYRDFKGNIKRVSCSCSQRAIERNQARREDYKDAHNGTDIFSDWDYLNIQKQAVRFPKACIEDSFYMENFNEGIQLMRTLFFVISEEGLTQDYYFMGEQGTYKTSLLCCMRNLLLERGTSCLMVTPQLIVQSANRNDRMMDFIYKADVLLVDDIGNGQISEESCNKVLKILKQKKANRMPVVYASRYPIKTLKSKGYSDEFVDFLMSQTGGPLQLTREACECRR